MTGFKSKKEMAESRFEENTISKEIEIGEAMALYAASRFSRGFMHWNNDEGICQKATKEGLDADLIWLTRQVLMGPALIWQTTGKAV